VLALVVEAPIAVEAPKSTAVEMIKAYSFLIFFLL